MKMLQEILHEIVETKERVIKIERHLKICKEIDAPLKELLVLRIEECKKGMAVEFSLDQNFDI